MDDVDVADWFAIVDKAVAWLLAHPGNGSLHAFEAIVETPAEQAFMAGLVAPVDRVELGAFTDAVHRAWAIRRDVPRARRR